jgi:hypothetical protein
LNNTFKRPSFFEDGLFYLPAFSVLLYFGAPQDSFKQEGMEQQAALCKKVWSSRIDTFGTAKHL